MIMRKRWEKRSGRKIIERLYEDENGIEVNEYEQKWDDWIDFRDGWRDKYLSDRTKIKRVNQARQNQHPEQYCFKGFRGFIIGYDDEFLKIHKSNQKQKMLLQRRNAMRRRQWEF